jgi:hypothetical protein
MVKVCRETGKDSFPSRAEAMLSCSRGRRRPDGKAKGGPKRVYRCRHCGAWHMTSQAKGAFPAKPRALKDIRIIGPNDPARFNLFPLDTTED